MSLALTDRDIFIPTPFFRVLSTTHSMSRTHDYSNKTLPPSHSSQLWHRLFTNTPTLGVFLKAHFHRPKHSQMGSIVWIVLEPFWIRAVGSCSFKNIVATVGVLHMYTVAPKLNEYLTVQTCSCTLTLTTIW